jgi:hypothetical protein
MDPRPKCKHRNDKTFRKTSNLGLNIPDLELNTDFLDMTSKAQVIKGNTDNLDFIKI